MIEFKYAVINSNENAAITPHFHSAYELTYYISGKGYSEYQEQNSDPLKPLWQEKQANYMPSFVDSRTKNKLSFCSGSCVIFPPYSVHNKVHTETSEFLAVVFGIVNPALVPQNKHYSIHSGRIRSLLSLIIEEHTQKKANYSQMIESILAEICIELGRNTQGGVSGNNSDFIGQTIHYINDYLLSDIDFYSYCKANGYSIDYFRHKFKEHTGKSPKAYVLTKRMEWAQRQLELTDFPVYHIAELCKFSDYSQFSTYFSKQFGVSPTQYRKDYSKENR